MALPFQHKNQTAKAASDNRYLELESNDRLKSRMQENCTSGSVRGSRQAFHFKYDERSVETVYSTYKNAESERTGITDQNTRKAA